MRLGSLFPTDPDPRRDADELGELLDEELGPNVRRLAYHAVLESGRSFALDPRDKLIDGMKRLATTRGGIVPHTH
ncbi:MAG: hypothetical protein H6Q34_82 [Deltaproteobacteria bacterium]|nr:hypothetical protein [Deltaproteobacteria bacterium]